MYFNLFTYIYSMIKSSEVKSYGKDEDCHLLLKSSDVSKINAFRINGMYFDKNSNKYKSVVVMPAHIVSWIPITQADATLFKQYNEINSGIKSSKVVTLPLIPNPPTTPNILPNISPKVGAFDPNPLSKRPPIGQPPIEQKGSGYGKFYYKYQKYKSKYQMSKYLMSK
jgi:hypothetical protein